MRDYQAIMFSNCQCRKFTYTREISICNKCGFKRTLGYTKEIKRKISKKDN